MIFSNPIQSSAKDQYEKVDPKEIPCSYGGFKRTETGKTESGKTTWKFKSASIDTLLCFGKVINLDSNEIMGNVIKTKKYGKIIVEFTPDYS